MIGSSGGSKISTGRKHITDWSAGLLMLSEGLEIELSNLNANNAMLKGNHLRQEVEIVIRGLPNILEVHVMSLVMSLGKIPFQGSILTNLFDPMRH